MSHECKQEVRIAKLEADTRVNDNSINNLARAIKSLTGEIKWLIRLFVAILLGVTAFLLAPYFGG